MSCGEDAGGMTGSELVLAYAYEDTYIDLYHPAVIIGGCFAVVAVVLSLFLILQHLRSYTNPAVSSFPISKSYLFD